MVNVLAEIAKGGFGRVEKVQLQDGTIAARKVFSPLDDIVNAVGREKLVRRFSREVKYQSNLPHELFIPIISFDLDSDAPSFLMPLAEANLASEIRISRLAGTIPFQALLDILDSLEWLHEHDFVHRDVKPENVLFHEGRWKLSDFGLILPPSDKTERFTTYHGFFTEMYCAPEQRRDFKDASFASDIYSFGCVLHDIYDGGARVPYQQARCGSSLGALIERCTEIDPKKRFRSVKGLRDALVTVHAAPTNVEPTPQAKEWVRRLESGEVTTPEHIDEMARFLSQANSRDEVWPVYAALSEDVLAALHRISTERWSELAKLYCAWARGGFDFDYCDVVARRLVAIFNQGSIGLRADAALAAADLGCSHNRWFVMWRVIEMCGHALDEPTAQRIVIEILAAEEQRNFTACAEVINNTIDVYHAKIAAILSRPAMHSSLPHV